MYRNILVPLTRPDYQYDRNSAKITNSRHKGVCMRVRVIQHVAFESPGHIVRWAQERGHDLAVTRAWNGVFPQPGQADLLVVLGGPMGAQDEATLPWLTAEKHYLAEAITEGLPVLGVCLGAQILATVIGGSVRLNREREIGWYPVSRTSETESSLLRSWPAHAIVGHWHGDTFELPQGMQPLLSSAACRNQAFAFDDRVVGVQFHLEWTADLMADMVRECGDEIANPGPTVMSGDALMAGVEAHGEVCRELLFGLLDDLSECIAPNGLR